MNSEIINTKQNYYYLTLMLIIIFFRIPYINSLYLSSDEILYLIIGRNILDGEIPNVDNYSNKSPLLYFFYILPSFFENTIFATRIYTIFYIFISSLLLFKVFDKKQNYIDKFLYIIFFIILINQHHGKALMAQTLALPFILLIYNFCLNKKIKFLNIFLCGVCASVSFLIHPVSLFLVFSLFAFMKLSDPLRLNLQKSLVFIFGYSVIFILLAIFYLIKNNFDIYPLFEAIFIIPYKWSLIYSEEPYIFFKTFYENIIKSRFFFLYSVVLIILLLNLFRIIKTLNTKIIFLFLISLLGIINLERNSWPHYIILLPGVILILSESLKKYKNKIKYVCILLVSLPPLIYQVNDFENMYSNNVDKMIDEDLKRITNEISKIPVENDEILIIDNHILYLLLDKKIPSKFKYHGYFFKNKRVEKERMVFNGPSFERELENLINEKKIKYLLVNKNRIKDINEKKFNKYFDSKKMILDRIIFKIK